MHIQKRASVNVHLCLLYICIYRISLLYMYIYERNKCAYMEESFRICAFSLPYMSIYGQKNAHIQKLASVNVHLAFCICAFTEACFRKCAFSPSVNAHMQKERYAFTEASFLIIFPSINAHLSFGICAFTCAFTQ